MKVKTYVGSSGNASTRYRDGKRFVKRADEKLTAFLELETAIRPTSAELHFLMKPALATQFAPQANPGAVRPLPA